MEPLNFRSILKMMKGAAFAEGDPSNLVGIVEGLKISKLQPLKARGFAKSGNVSLSGEHLGRRVKVSSMFTTSQVEFRRQLAKMSGQIFLPKVVGTEGRMLIEEWIDGRSPGIADRVNIRAVIRQFYTDEERFSYDKTSATDFDYLDYLEQRVSKWDFIEALSRFLKKWRVQRKAISTELPYALCNPDLSFANFVIENGTNRIYMVDTEFLHVGQGWFMDHYNSAIRAEPERLLESSKLVTFYRNCVTLRKIGSALIVGRPDLLRSETMEFQDE